MAGSDESYEIMTVPECPTSRTQSRIDRKRSAAHLHFVNDVASASPFRTGRPRHRDDGAG